MLLLLLLLACGISNATECPLPLRGKHNRIAGLKEKMAAFLRIAAVVDGGAGGDRVLESRLPWRLVLRLEIGCNARGGGTINAYHRRMVVIQGVCCA